MSISVIDAAIILFIALGTLIGFKQGAVRTGVRFVGTFVIVIISFILKDKLMVLLYENLPFFNFFGVIQGIDAINILLYQLISFLIIFTALTFVLRVLLVVTGLIELLLKMTIFLNVPSKILGAILGALEFYCYIFIALYILNMPVFNLQLVNSSNLGTQILETTPILSTTTESTIKVYTDVWNIIKNKDDKSNGEINTLVLATLLDNHLISIDSAKKLVESNKIYISDETILDNYDENEDDFYEKIKEAYNENYN